MELNAEVCSALNIKHKINELFPSEFNSYLKTNNFDNLTRSFA
jgi:hypothetical protein